MKQKALPILIILILLAVQAIGGFASGVSAEETGQSSLQLHGLVGEYYISSGRDQFDFYQKKDEVIDPNINFRDLNPILKSLTGQDEYNTVRWTGQIEPEYSEEYTFSMIGDNGFRLWINNQLIIDHWVDDWDKEQIGKPITLEAGKKYDIKVEYFENWGGANLYLNWSSASQPKQIVPHEAFYLPEGYVYDGPSSASISEDGKTAEIQFVEPLNPLPGGIADHLSLNVVGHPWPISKVSLKQGDDSVMMLEFEYPVYGKDADVVRLNYDGKGGLTTKEGRSLSAFNSLVVNHSKYLIQSPWAEKVSADNVLPEYPRPQMVRSKWMNLNGEWQFAPAKQGDPLPSGKTLKEKILVPFAMEAKLSGVERHEERSWYKRQFTVPDDWAGQRVLLHFGAVDWEASVYVNGKKAGTHRGGYDSFSFDVTEYLVKGKNELIVEVYDPTDKGDQAIGKQRLNPGGIWYTSVTGIWQTVWLEPVPTAHITQLDMVPNIHNEILKLTVKGEKVEGATVEAIALKNGKEVGRASGTAGSEIKIPVPNPTLWSPDDPFLYDLKVELKNGTSRDQVNSYFGMREIKLAKDEKGILRPMLNGKFVFQMGPLDQGYWPDGIYTAPTDEALRFDIEVVKKLGMNMIRKHMKVEPDRWYYWADQLGVVVWQDMPSMFYHQPLTQEKKQQFENEFKEMIDQHRSHPSIVVWTVFNEGWGQYDTERLTNWVKDLDPTRLVNNASGWTDKGVGDLIDWHCYVGPCAPTPTSTRAAVLGEYGGLGLKVPGHEWSPNVFNYEMQESKEALTKRYLGLIDQIKQMKDTGLSAAVYTQTTDVEIEINGLLTYDRKVEKADFIRLRQAHKELAGTSIPATRHLIEMCEDSGEIKHPLAAELINQLNQAEHQLSAGHQDQAVKHIDDFLKHLNKKVTDKFVTGQVKELLKVDANMLKRMWQ
ncbi:FIMAH domain-containing protein [Paenactinomyces guangxiensis]|uniref:Glycoside hydrolase family 2 n=1 Tax=Paenactinomyces guangxiensis TaxID=1490290 RepID=A0A7W2A857_9BACL|nr:PA14 domain-containing protein [Paenactinomyces guangxiensis]MBA4494315.1 glycoside hydrolase family 2 [Paenactinomyces guangxiensis]MBH8590809.1 hypothetical protein [Paenactinomyces guangxiensis]